MTTHIFIVDETTFKVHLKYLFAGTGAGEKDVDFNKCSNSSLYPSKMHASESGLVSMMADCCRIRKGDLIFFYLQATSKQEGKFFGVFKAAGNAFLDKKTNPQYLRRELGKNLTFRVKILPFKVYKEGVTEWKALDEIRNISSPFQMLWSLIYRKLKGNRGNTMITIYESERLLNLIQKENNHKALPVSKGYSYDNGTIVPTCLRTKYNGITETFDILPRLLKKSQIGKSFEAHLQMFILQKLGRCSNIDQALGISNKIIEWIGNEVSCGVGMQRIDIMLSIIAEDDQRIVAPIELKIGQAKEDNILQISRYIDWIEQYYIPNRISIIQPILVCCKGGLNTDLSNKFKAFNKSSTGRFLPLRYVEYTIKNNRLHFSNVVY